MFIVFGTGTYFKRNRTETDGTCEHCGYIGRLNSYDGLKCFALYWIPVLPMGQHHVIDECPNCKMGRAVPAGRWRVLRERMEAAYEAFEANPTVAARAIDALGAAMASRDQPRFLDVAVRIEESFAAAADADMLTELGQGYEQFMMLEEAEGAYREALRIGQTNPRHFLLARLLCNAGRLDEAAAHVKPLLASQDVDFAYPPMLLAELYHNAGRHDESLALLDRIGQLWPEIAEDKAVKKLVKQVRKKARV